MPAALRPQDVVVVLVELQDEVVASSQSTPASSLRKAVTVLAEGARALALPVYASVVPLSPDKPPALIAELAGQEALVRTTVSALDHEPIRDGIARSGRKVVAVGGVSAEIGVLHTTLGALAAGYQVHVLVDAVGGLSARSEQAAFLQLEKAGATLSSVASFLTSMTPTMTDPDGQAVFAALARFWS